MTKHKQVIERLQRAMRFKSKKDRAAILDYLSDNDCVFNTLQQIARNIENLSLTPAQDRRLYPHKETINSLRTGTKSKKRQALLVKQTGGFLPWLIPVAAAILPTIIDLFK